MKKENLYISLGEFGYSILLRFFIANLKDKKVSVLCRNKYQELYKDLCKVIIADDYFEQRFSKYPTSGWYPFIDRCLWHEYLNKKYRSDYEIKQLSVKIETLFMHYTRKIPIKYTNKRIEKPAIVVCSRIKYIDKENKNYECNKRNIPKSYYLTIIRKLCKKYPNYDVISIGVPEGSFNFPEIKHINFKDMVGELKTVQDTINVFNRNCVCIASQSAFSFLCFNQGVPVFTIGENEYLYTRSDLCNEGDVFYNIGGLENYGTFNIDKCCKSIEGFINDRCSLLNL